MAELDDYDAICESCAEEYDRVETCPLCCRCPDCCDCDEFEDDDGY